MFENQWFYLFCISMLPVVELRGGIPVGAAMGLPFWAVYPVCILGNLLPAPFLILFAKTVLQKLATLPKVGGFFSRLIRRADEKAEQIGKYEKWGLFLLVAIPLPGTGAWTGALVATLFDIRIGVALPAILAGVLIAGGVMTAVSCGVLSLF